MAGASNRVGDEVRKKRTLLALNKRSRLVTFRVSSEEYEHVTEACIGAGSRSVSEFARLAVLQRIEALKLPPGTLSGDLATLGRALGELDQSLSDARKRIRGVLGPMGPGGEGETTA